MKEKSTDLKFSVVPLSQMHNDGMPYTVVGEEQAFRLPFGCIPAVFRHYCSTEGNERKFLVIYCYRHTSQNSELKAMLCSTFRQ